MSYRTLTVNLIDQNDDPIGPMYVIVNHGTTNPGRAIKHRLADDEIIELKKTGDREWSAKIRMNAE